MFNEYSMSWRCMPLIHLSWPPDICGAVEATITKPNVSSNGDGGDSHNAHALVTLFYFQRKDRSRGLWVFNYEWTSKALALSLPLIGRFGG